LVKEVLPSRRVKKPRQSLMAATNSMKTSKTKKTVILLMAQKFVTRNL
jgi:hypothetical protein